MNTIVHRLSIILGLLAFGVSTAIGLAAGVSTLGMVLRATLAFAIVAAITRTLFGTACDAIARDLAVEDQQPTEDEAGQKA